MTTSRRPSVALFVILPIVGTLSLLLALFGVVGYRHYSDRQWAAFNQTHDVSADQFKIAVQPAIWSLNFPLVAKLMEGPLGNPSVRGLMLHLDDRKLIMARDATGRPVELDQAFDTTGLVLRERKLDHEGQELGAVRIYADTDRLERDLQSALLFIGALVFLVDAILSLALYVALKQLVLEPLRRLERYADLVARHQPGQAEALQTLRFVGELERLTGSVDAMVTELEARNLQLTRSISRFERVIRLFPTPIALFDHLGEMLYLNDRFTEALGYTLPELPDMDVWMERAFPDPTYRAVAAALWKQATSYAIANDNFIRPAIYQITCANGAVKSIEVCGILTADVTVAVLTDVTERIQSERELSRHREHLEELVASRTKELEHTYRRLEETEFAMNHAGISIQWIDATDGRFVYVNERACELYGYSREALLSMRPSDIAADFATEALAALVPNMRQDGQARIDSMAKTANGRMVPIETVLYLQQSASATPGHYITFTTDVTQQMAAKEALIAAKAAAEAAARARSEFLANMSHEIRTPMNAIIGMSLLALRTDLDPKQRNYIEKVHRSAGALLGILNDILDFSKVEAGRLDIEKVEFRLDQVLDNVCNVITLRAEEKSLEFLLDIAPEVPQALIGDPLRLTQILVNLAGNAVKFTERGQVVVGCRVREEDSEAICLEFWVRDSGIGMTDEQRARLFSAFSQADTSITRRFGGTGLGLAISKRLVELLDGDISVTSRVGEGSTFTFTVRLGRSKGSTLTWGGAPRILPGNLASRRVLIVDDNPEAREIFREIVKRFGFIVDEAHSALAALEHLRGTTCDVLICDWKMPGMDGVELVRELQQRDDIHAPASIILVSAYSMEELRQEAKDLDLAGILAKPATPSVIFDAIVAAFAGPTTSQRSHGASRATAIMPAADLAGRSILLVEDNPINQELAYELLTSAAMVVTVAGNGQEALDWLEKRDFDCVLMDVQMPILDGLEATRRIRRQNRFEHLPIIAMTAGAMAEEKEATIAAGMNDHVTKPIDVDQMFATMARWLGSGTRRTVAESSPAGGGEANRLPGLDIEFGLRSVNSKPSLYRKLLAAYVIQAESNAQSLRAALTNGDAATMRRLAHTIKGSSATLGMHQVYEAAQALESATKDNVPADAESRLADLQDKHSVALISIQRYLAVPT